MGAGRWDESCKVGWELEGGMRAGRWDSTGKRTIKDENTTCLFVKFHVKFHSMKLEVEFKVHM